MGEKKRGRPNKYETHVKPRLKEIGEMALTMTDKEIASVLGIGHTAWCSYKEQYSELANTLKKSREKLVSSLKQTLIEKAQGYTYSEKKTIIEHGEVTREEIYEKHMPADVAALNLLLKNYDKDNWANDPQALKLRQKELELQERKIEQGEW